MSLIPTSSSTTNVVPPPQGTPPQGPPPPLGVQSPDAPPPDAPPQGPPPPPPATCVDVANPTVAIVLTGNFMCLMMPLFIVSMLNAYEVGAPIWELMWPTNPLENLVSGHLPGWFAWNACVTMVHLVFLDLPLHVHRDQRDGAAVAANGEEGIAVDPESAGTPGQRARVADDVPRLTRLLVAARPRDEPHLFLLHAHHVHRQAVDRHGFLDVQNQVDETHPQGIASCHPRAVVALIRGIERQVDPFRHLGVRRVGQQARDPLVRRVRQHRYPTLIPRRDGVAWAQAWAQRGARPATA